MQGKLNNVHGRHDLVGDVLAGPSAGLTVAVHALPDFSGQAHMDNDQRATG